MLILLRFCLLEPRSSRIEAEIDPPPARHDRLP
jgi:hypothetical protein